MKITLLGVLALVAVGALLLYVVKQMHDDHEKGTISGGPTLGLDPPDALRRDLDSQ